MPNAFGAQKPRCSLPLLATALVVCGCDRAPEATMPRALPVPAVMSVTTGGEESFLALSVLDTVTWKDQAAWLAVPTMAPGESRMVTGFTLGPASDSALVFWAMGGRSHASTPTMPVRFHSLLLGQGRGERFPPDPAPLAEEGPPPDWCETETWIAAFFLDGVGPRPSQPVVVEHRVSGQVHRLVVDPERNTVRAEPTLRVRLEAAETGEGTQPRLQVGARLDTAHSNLIPLFVAWGGRMGGVPGAPHGASFGLIASLRPENPLREWRAYFLAGPPGYPRGLEGAAGDPCVDDPPDDRELP